MALYLKWSFWQASYDFKVFRLLEGGKSVWRVEQLLGFHVFLYLPVEKVKLWEDPEQRGLLWEGTQGSGSQLNSIELISFTSVCSRAGRHAQLGKVAQLTHRCHLHAHLKSQPPCIVRSCGNQLSSSSALKGVPGIPVWWEALHYPWLFRHFTWKTIWVLHLWIDLAYEELFSRKLWSWHRTSMPVGASECFSAHL